MTVPVYNGPLVRLTVQRDGPCLSIYQGKHVRVLTAVYAFCLLLQLATLAVDNNDGSNLERLHDYLCALICDLTGSF